MAHNLDTLIAAFLPPTCAVHLTQVTVEQATVWLQLMATAPTAPCPCCAVSSSSIHSRYQRHLTDLPWGTHAVHLQLTVRKFFCRTPTCARRIFTERLPDFVAAYARNTSRVVAALRAIGMALGGNAGARLAARLQLPISPPTLLRLVRAAPVPHTPALQAVGIDEWAWRRGHRYGTILVDLMTHRVVDLLPDRSAAGVAAWLAQHPTITMACRDRSDLYADGIRRGAPQAVQVVDRFHLAQNLRQALEAFLLDRRLVLQDAAVSRAIALLPTASPFPLTPMYRGRRRRRTRHARRRTPAGSPSMRPYTRSGRRGRPSPPWPGSWGSAARPCMPTSFVMVCPAATRSADAQRYLDQLCQMEASIARAHELSHAFLTMVRERRGIDLAAWMAEAMPSGIEALARFARGLQEDLAAIAAGLTLDWSNGPVEGQITRLTLLKRQAYGRAGFPLLRQRIRHAA